MKNPSLDPYSLENSRKPLDELLLTTVYCLPMRKPSSWSYSRYTYSIKDEFLGFCAVPNAEDYATCVCPSYYAYSSTSHPFLRYLSSDFYVIILNGMVAFKTIVGLLTNDSFGYYWSTLFPEAVFGPELAYAFSLYDPNVMSFNRHLGCVFLHAASLLSFIFFCLIYYLFLLWFYDVFTFVTNGGKAGFIKRG